MVLKLLAFSLIATASFLNAPTARAEFNPLDKTCSNQNAAQSPICQQYRKQKGSTENPIVNRIQTVTNLFAVLTGLFAVIIIIYGGFVFATAGGSIGGQRSTDNATRAKQGRAMVTGAVIGLVIVALGWTIVTFVTNNLIH